MWQFGMAPRCYMTAVNEAWVTDCMTPKPQDPRIYRSYSAQICAPSCPSRVEKKKCLRSLFCKFKTLVSFPEAVAFAWLDQADLGLSRRPRPSPLDGSSASHAICSTRGAAPWRTAESRENQHSHPGGARQSSGSPILRPRWTKKSFAFIYLFIYLCASLKLFVSFFILIKRKGGGESKQANQSINQ